MEFHPIRPNIAPLTSIRFFAAFVVMISHYGDRMLLFPHGLANYGYEAVTFFFILSGFVLTYKHGRQSGLDISYSDFLNARVARLAPAYFLALVIAAPFFVVAVSRDFGLAPALALVPTMLQAWIPKFSDTWNGPAWSLSNEMFFYLLFPALFALALKINRSTFLSLALASVMLVSFLRINYLEGEGWHQLRSFFPLFNLPLFAVGIALSILFISLKPLPNSASWMLVLFSLAGIVVDIAFADTSPTAREGTLLCLLYSAMVYGTAGLKVPVGSVVSSPALVTLGEASYATYILHYPILMWWNHLTKFVLKLGLPLALDFTIYAAIVLAVSVVVLRLFEAPCSRYIRQLGMPVHKDLRRAADAHRGSH